MNRQAFLPLIATASLGVATDLAAQNSWPVPYNADLAEGQESVSIPFGVPGFRTQILIDGSAVGQNGALLSGLRFRVDRPSLPLAASSVPNGTVQVGETTVPNQNLQPTFAANITSPLTTVFTGTVNLPGGPEGYFGPAAWDIVIPFSAPFVFTTANGSLLIDIVGNNPAGGFPNFWLDAMQTGGSASQYGQSGDNPSGDFLNLIVSTGGFLNPRQISLGNAVEFNSTLFFTSPPGVLALGIAPTPGPIDLGFLGATNQYLHIDPLIFVPHSWTQTFIGFASTFSLGIPNDPTWIDDVIYAQSALIDPTANPFGMILSHAVEVRIADPLINFLPGMQLNSDDPTSATGTLLDFSFGINPDYGMVPVLLEGMSF